MTGVPGVTCHRRWRQVRVHEAAERTVDGLLTTTGRIAEASTPADAQPLRRSRP